MNAIVVRELRKAYGGVLAVGGISFTVDRGEVFALVGPNGAGKTTTVEILEGHRQRCGGEVSVLGFDPATGGRAYRERIGIVLQQAGVDEGFSARELVRLYAGFYPRPRPVDEVIALVGLEDLCDVPVTVLSGGERRRVDLALGLIGDPELIFLDEPTAGFDPFSRRRAWDVVANLCAVGKTVLLTTHYLVEARKLANRVGVLARGRLVAVGSPAELARNGHGGNGTIRFRLPDDLAGCDLPDVGHRLTIGPDRIVELRSAAPTEDLQWLTRWARDHQVELHGLTLAEPSFEDAYLALIGRVEAESGA